MLSKLQGRGSLRISSPLLPACRAAGRADRDEVIVGYDPAADEEEEEERLIGGVRAQIIDCVISPHRESSQDDSQWK